MCCRIGVLPCRLEEIGYLRQHQAPYREPTREHESQSLIQPLAHGTKSLKETGLGYCRKRSVWPSKGNCQRLRQLTIATKISNTCQLSTLLR